MEVIANRSCNIAGIDYKSGDKVTGLSPDKEAQLVAQRWLRNAEEGPKTYVATREFMVKKRLVKIGDKLRVSTLAPAKLHQLLEHRYLEPAPPSS